MLTGKTSVALWDKLKTAPPAWLRSKDGQRLIHKAIALVRKNDGDGEAKAFENLLTVSSVIFLFGDNPWKN